MTEIKGVVTATVQDSLRKFELELSRKIGIEIGRFVISNFIIFLNHTCLVTRIRSCQRLVCYPL